VKQKFLPSGADGHPSPDSNIAIPQYAQILTGDAVIEELTWKYVLWYYDQLDVIYASSRSASEELMAKGIPADKIKVYPRGIDIALFHPEKRCDILRDRFRIDTGVTLLYVGRVSREKNLHHLADVFRRLVTRRPEVHLVVSATGLTLMRCSPPWQTCPAISAVI
jgi:glycosyltransferase involved in cell wall biosynthesis